MPTETKDKGRVRELKQKLQVKADEIGRIADSFVDETGDGHFVIANDQLAAYKKAVGEGDEIKSLLELEEKRGQINEFLNAPAGTPLAARDAADYSRGAETKTLGQAWLASDQYAEMKDSGFRKFADSYDAGVGIRAIENRIEAKDIYSAMAGNYTIPALGTPQQVGLTPRQLRPGRVRDLFPQDTTTSNMLIGLRETGFVNAATTVPERTASNGGPATGGSTDVYGLKPMSNMSFVPVNFPVATIAHWVPVHRDTLADEPRMQGLIDRNLVDGVKLAEDWEILYGDGTGTNLTGITNTPGIQEYPGVNGQPRTAQIRRAITRAALAYYTPTGVVTHLLDWEELELETDSYGQYRLAISVAMGGQKVVWRLNVVDTVAIQEGTYLLGAFGYGAKLYDREQVNVAISTEDSDNFRRNVVTLRGEERLALEISRPEAFVLGTYA